MNAPTSPTLPSAPAIRAALVLDPDNAFWYGRKELPGLTDLVTWRESLTDRVARARDTIHCIAEQVDQSTNLPHLLSLLAMAADRLRIEPDSAEGRLADEINAAIERERLVGGAAVVEPRQP